MVCFFIVEVFGQLEIRLQIRLRICEKVLNPCAPAIKERTFVYQMNVRYSF